MLTHINLKVTEKDRGLILGALKTLPYMDVEGTIASLVSQRNEQIQADIKASVPQPQGPIEDAGVGQKVNPPIGSNPNVKKKKK